MNSYFKKHVFFCTNLKTNGRKCCQQADACDMSQFAKAELKERDLFGPGKIRISQSGCLGRCSDGPCLVIYPEGVWYTYASKDDVLEIIDKYLCNNEIVERLLLISCAK